MKLVKEKDVQKLNIDKIIENQITHVMQYFFTSDDGSISLPLAYVGTRVTIL